MTTFAIRRADARMKLVHKGQATMRLVIVHKGHVFPVDLEGDIREYDLSKPIARSEIVREVQNAIRDAEKNAP